MYIISKPQRKFLAGLAFLLMLCSYTVNGQIYPVSINITVLPPYTSSVYDYINNPNKIIATATLTTREYPSADIYFKGTITSDGGIVIKTKDAYKPGNYIHLGRGTVIPLTPDILSNMFDINQIDVKGISIKDLLSGAGLPEDNYQICVRAYDFHTNQPLSDDEPVGCSNIFSVTNLETPIITTPFCGDTINTGLAQNIIVSWTIPAGAIGCQYKFQVVEIPENAGIDPNDAFNIMGRQPYYEEIVPVNVIALTPDRVMLTPGYTYAFRVQAYDPLNKAYFRNNGYSEVCWFLCKAPVKSLIPDATVSDGSQISGKAEYFYKDDNISVKLSNISMAQGSAKVPKKPAASTSSGQNTFSENLVSQTGHFPLVNTPVELVKAWSITEVFKVNRPVGKDSTGNYIYGEVDSIPLQQSSDILFGSTSPNPDYPNSSGCGTVIASTTTDEAGNYHFNIPSTFKTEILDTFSVGADVSGDGKAHHLAYATCLWVRYASPYYYPGYHLLFIQDKVMKDGVSLLQQAKNYSLKVNLKNYDQSKNYYTNKLIPTTGSENNQLDVYVLKLNKSNKAPVNECGSDGKPVKKNIGSQEYYVYAKKTGVQNGSVTFYDLIKNEYPSPGTLNDDYYIYAEPKDGKNVSYQPVKYTWNTCFGGCTDNYGYDANTGKTIHKEMDLSPYHISLGVSGKLKKCFALDNGSADISNATPLANVPIKLVGQWVIKNNADGKVYPINGNSYDFAAGTTNSDGEFFLNTGNTTFAYLGENGVNQYQNSTGDYYDKNGNVKKVSGKEYYVLRIKVQSPYYYSPDNNLLVEPGYNYNLGDLMAYVRESDVKINALKTVNPDYGLYETGGLYNPNPKAGELVYLCINPNTVPADFPVNETKLYSLSKKEIENNGVTYKVIDEATSTSGGSCLFRHSVLNDPQNAQDRYYYFSESPAESFDNYSSENVNSMGHVTDPQSEQKTFYNSTRFLKEYNQQKYLHQIESTKTLYTWAQTPTISGAVYPESDYSTNPLQGVTVEVYDIPEAAISEIGFGDNGILGAIFKAKLTANFGIAPDAVMQTGLNGKFQFSVNTKEASKTNRKLVYFSKNGFTPYGFFINGGAKIKKGQKASLSKIFMELPATVLGSVVDDETNEYIHARVVVGDDFSWSETKESYEWVNNGANTEITGQTLVMSAPRTNGVAFHVYPLDNDTYEPLTEYHDIHLFGEQPNFTFRVKRREHHIFIRAHSPGSDYVKNNIPIKATVLNTSPDIVSTDNVVTEKDKNNVNVQVHQAKLEFPSSAKTFLVKLESMASGSCYESKIVSIEDNAAYLHTFNFELKPCKKIVCHVDDDKGNPAANVKLYIEDKPYTVPEVYTDINGNAELSGVPADGSHTIVAVPPASMKNYYGSRKVVNVTSYTGTPVKLQVRYFDAMDITALLGFPIEVKNITIPNKGPNAGKYYISGSMTVTNGNSVFKIPHVSTGLGSANENNNFDFENIEIVPSSKKGTTGLPLAVPKTDFWSTTTVKAIKVFDYDAYTFSWYGAFVKKLSDNSGKIQSPVFLEPATFKKGFSIPQASNAMYINTPNYSGKTLNLSIAEFLDLFSSDGSTPSTLGKDFKISTWNYKNAFYKLHNRYNAEAIIDGSAFDNAGLHLDTKLHTAIPQLANPDINLKVGIVQVTPEKVIGIYHSTHHIEIPMDNWKFSVNNWTLNAAGLTVTGNISAGALTVPAKDVLIDKDCFNYGTFEVGGIKLGGNIPLNLDKSNTSVSFGFDPAFGTNGSWSLSMLPLKGDKLTSIKNLPGLNATDEINLKNISLYSRGSDNENVIMLSETTPWVTLHKQTKFHPSMAYASSGSINFRGRLDLQIPKMCDLADAFTLRYETKSNGLTLLPPDEPFKNLEINTKGVKIQINENNQIFVDNKLVLHAKIYDQNPLVNYAFDVTLTKTPYKTEILIDSDTQKFVYSNGTSGLEKVTGNMKVINNNTEWNNFKFEGDLYGLTGIADAKKHLNFVVEGDLVANNQAVGVNNIAVDGLGTGGITYDFTQHALVGNMHIERDLSNCHLSGDVDLKFGGGDWYIFGSTIAGNIQNSPVSSGKCGFFVGSGTINANIQNVLAQYFYEQLLPDNFPTGSYTGALFCSEAAVPVPILPQLNINLDPVVHCTLEHAIHLNSYTGISLDYPKVAYNLGGQLYVYIHAGAGASAGVACCGADFSASAGGGVNGHIGLDIPGASTNPVQMMGNIKNSIANADIVMQGEVFLNMQGSAYVGGGLCDSDCDGHFCETTSWGKGMDIIVTCTFSKSEGIKIEGKKWNFH